MGYDKSKIEVLDPLNGYNLAAKIYNKFHKILDDWDNGLWQRYLPRDISEHKIIDLGAGDCRMSKYFRDKNISEYWAVDISENMLKRCKSWIKTIRLDLEDTKDWDILPKNYFDIASGFFVLLHLENLDSFFFNLYNILKIGGKAIFLHHIERRQYIYNINGKQFKIKSFTHSINDIIDFAEKNWFFVEYNPIIEKGVNIGYIILLKKNN